MYILLHKFLKFVIFVACEYEKASGENYKIIIGMEK